MIEYPISSVDELTEISRIGYCWHGVCRLGDEAYGQVQSAYTPSYWFGHVQPSDGSSFIYSVNPTLNVLTPDNDDIANHRIWLDYAVLSGTKPLLYGKRLYGSSGVGNAWLLWDEVDEVTWSVRLLTSTIDGNSEHVSLVFELTKLILDVNAEKITKQIVVEDISISQTVPAIPSIIHLEIPHPNSFYTQYLDIPFNNTSLNLHILDVSRKGNKVLLGIFNDGFDSSMRNSQYPTGLLPVTTVYDNDRRRLLGILLVDIASTDNIAVVEHKTRNQTLGAYMEGVANPGTCTTVPYPGDPENCFVVVWHGTSVHERNILDRIIYAHFVNDSSIDYVIGERTRKVTGTTPFEVLGTEFYIWNTNLTIDVSMKIETHGGNYEFNSTARKYDGVGPASGSYTSSILNTEIPLYYTNNTYEHSGGGMVWPIPCCYSEYDGLLYCDYSNEPTNPATICEWGGQGVQDKLLEWPVENYLFGAGIAEETITDYYNNTFFQTFSFEFFSQIGSFAIVVRPYSDALDGFEQKCVFVSSRSQAIEPNFTFTYDNFGYCSDPVTGEIHLHNNKICVI